MILSSTLPTLGLTAASRVSRLMSTMIWPHLMSVASMRTCSRCDAVPAPRLIAE